MFFGWRARDEHHRVKYGDIKIKCEDGPEGREYRKNSCISRTRV